MFEGNHRLRKAEGLGTGTCPAPSGESPPYAQEVYGGGNSPLLKITPGNVPEEIDGTPNTVPSGSPEIYFYANSVQASYNDNESIPIDTVSSSIENSVDVNTTDKAICTCTFIISDKYYFNDNQSSTLDPKVTNPCSKAFNFAGSLSSSFSSDPSVIVNGSDASSFSFGTTPTWCESFTTTVSPHDSILGLPIWVDTDFLSRIPEPILATARPTGHSIYFMVENVPRFSGNDIIQMPVQRYSRSIQNPLAYLTDD
ncbi:MAG: hypothetical protein CBD35_04410 [Verrucomicrobia bacterium TMED175]|nr:MAG: hypothetical protein CBD35_04410 [Verrucomicrobia bacterium TMED175]|tara:strand:- start:417 stop:1181 length:765 start_codon:yes stop_codon:yes gene_type:complete